MLTPRERQAYYIVYNKKCSYCSKEILYENLEMDHIIPLSFNEDISKLNGILNEIRKTCPKLLPDDFSLKHYLNLLPACKKCNSEKSKSFDKDHVIHFLTKSKKGLPYLLERIEKMKKIQSLQPNLINLSSKLSSLEEIEDFAKRLHLCCKAVQLENPLKFKNCQKKVLNTEENLLDLELELQLGELTLKNDIGDVKKVKTIREWRDAIKNDYYALSTYDMQEESYFRVTSNTIDIAKKAQTPIMSYINNPKLGVTDIKFLSLEFLPENFLSGTCEEYLLKNKNKGAKSVKEFIDSGELKITDVTRNSINIEDSGVGVHYKELLRADLNDDGIEDILVFLYIYVLEGTMQYGDTAIISKKTSDSFFVFL